MEQQGQPGQNPPQPASNSGASNDPPQMVYVSRPINPSAPHIDEAAMARHETSKKMYPTLNLSQGEYVISAVKRHPIGLVPIFGFTGLLLIILGISVPFYASMQSSSSNLPPLFAYVLIVVLVSLLIIIGAYVAVYVYTGNKFFLTNESVIQEIKTSLFDKHEQTVSLINIEDSSYEQRGVLQQMLNYGSIRLSTEGDETTYRFTYVANPKKEVAVLNNAVEAFKNGRPVLND
jgi:hypothetical protein